MRIRGCSTGTALCAVVLSAVCVQFCVSAHAQEEAVTADGLSFGLPMGGISEEPDLGICPQGARVIGMFLALWQQGDYRGMYDLLDDESKEGYSFEQARFDFQFLEFKPYRISSVKKSGENYEFVLSYGDWKDGSKDLKKMIINGTTFKIVMPARNSVFKESLENYF